MVWNPTLGETKRFRFGNYNQSDVEAKDNGVRSVSFSPDGANIASASDRTIRIWDTAKGQLLDSYEMEQVVVNVAFWTDGNRIAAATNRLSVCLAAAKIPSFT
ncbi:MAG: hypothetical protein KDA87_07040 [Planctomycetales bacterium]|nr:hypothetical protein [Planctomycetales bacterium]